MDSMNQADMTNIVVIMCLIFSEVLPLISQYLPKKVQANGVIHLLLLLAQIIVQKKGKLTLQDAIQTLADETTPIDPTSAHASQIQPASSVPPISAMAKQP